MKTIQRIKEFLHQYRTLNPYMKDLLQSSYDYYQKELIKHYLRLSTHPYPNEMTDENKDINRYIHKQDLTTLQRTQTI